MFIFEDFFFNFFSGPISMARPCIICLFSTIYPLCTECSPKVTVKYDEVWDKSLKKLVGIEMLNDSDYLEFSPIISSLKLAYDFEA